MLENTGILWNICGLQWYLDWESQFLKNVNQKFKNPFFHGNSKWHKINPVVGWSVAIFLKINPMLV